MDFQNLKDFMDRLTAWKIPGNSISVYHKNKEAFRYSSGYADIETGIKMTGDELLNIYSCTKVSTVVAALKLYEQGYFLLDDPLYEYIPEFRNMYVKTASGDIVPAKKPITIQNLFTMTAGFSYDLNSPSLKQARLDNPKMPTLETIKYLAKEPLLFEPGEKWEYSLGHDVLAGLVEVISGKRFADYVKENIFSPIGIEDIYYHRDDEIKDRMASQYHLLNDSTDDLVKAQISGDKSGKVIKVSKDSDFVFGTEYDSGGAGIVVSVSEYARFASTLANNGIAPNGEKIISGKTIDLLRTNQLNSEQLKIFDWKQIRGYGYGLGVRTLIDKVKSGSNGPLGEFGWGGAAGATLLCDPENEIAFFYAHHMLNPQEDYYQPRLRNVFYGCL
ncbi:MAG: serine hydrolase domain-containing protein [Clostridia bacterium]|nr:serine hydrolase domain-containing protein [Clostridia bacterium]